MQIDFHSCQFDFGETSENKSDCSYMLQTQTESLKFVSTTFLLVCFPSLNESTCQTRKNVFHFTSKALFVLEKIKF